MEKSHTTPYHSIGNGERFNRILSSMLRTLNHAQKKNWKAYIPTLVHAYNFTRHESTKVPPFYLIFGKEPRLPLDIVFGLDGFINEEQTLSDYTISQGTINLLLQLSIKDGVKG